MRWSRREEDSLSSSDREISTLLFVPTATLTIGDPESIAKVAPIRSGFGGGSISLY